MTEQKKAFLFDLNGTVINDMEFHIQSWYQILNKLAQLFHTKKRSCNAMEKTKNYWKGFFPGVFRRTRRIMILEKETRYQENFRPHMKLIDGLGEFLEKAYAANIKMAIGSAAIPFNINYILDGLQLHKYFPVVVSASDVVESKPHPATFLLCAERLNIAPQDCIVFEDSPKGVEAAARAGMKAVVITTMHTPDDFTEIILFVYRKLRRPV